LKKEFIKPCTNLNDCARVECGPVALYCYESVDLPLGSVLVFQPQHFPAPVISVAANPSRCYHKPAFVRTVVENYGTVFSGVGEVTYGSYAMPVELATCGVSFLYEACNGNEQIVVVNESSPTVYYGGQCWTNPQVVVEYGTTIQRVAGTDVIPVSGCSDVLCTGSDASGLTIGYVDQQLGNTVNVQFNNLNIGIPYYGVSDEKIDDGESGLKSGQTTVHFDHTHLSAPIINSVPANGRLEIQVLLKGMVKKLVVTRSGTDTVYNLTQGDNNVFLDVHAGDRLRLEIAKTHVRVAGSVKWKSAPLSLRRYDEVTLNYVGTTAVNAVGFCGLAARTPYVFFGTIPALDVTTYPNPDTYLTVQGATGPEYVLVTSQAVGERLPVGPDNTTAYAGEGVVGPLTFRFYTGRGAAGAHGEMDVWLDSPGQFPNALAAGRYSLLVRPDDWYRRTAQVGDTRRSSLTVEAADAEIRLPRILVSPVGYQIVATGVYFADELTTGGTTYELTGTAYGLAYTIIDIAPLYPVLSKVMNSVFISWTYASSAGRGLPHHWSVEGADSPPYDWQSYGTVAGDYFQFNGHHNFSYWRVVGRDAGGLRSTEYSNEIVD